MFQNIAQDYDEYEIQDVEQENTKQSRFKIKNLLSVQSIVLYVISFFASMVSFEGEMAPFGLAIFAAACSNRIPSVFLFIINGIAILLGFGVNTFLTYLLTGLIFIAEILIIKPKVVDDDRNEKQKLGVALFVATTLVQVSKMFFGIFLIYDLLVSLMIGIVTYIFYKIFSNSLIVITDFKIKKAFSIEEVIGASLFLSIAVSAFSGVKIFDLSITNIFSIMFVLILGWKNGMLIGATSGITIGVVLGIINSTKPILLAAYALSGMVAGILNRLGKIGVIVGFIAGNAIIAYTLNGNVAPVILLKEILVASLGLLIVPKNVSINIEDLLGKNKLLPVSSNNKLEGKVETIQKLNSMSETISEIARSYNEAAATVEEDFEEIKQKNIFKAELINNMDSYSNNILYDEIVDLEEGISDKIYEKLELNEEINKEDLIKIFEDSNSFIVGLDDQMIAPTLNKDILDVVKVINDTYKINKLNLIWNKKMQDNKKSLSHQLNGVSQAISSLADDISEETKKEDEPHFMIQVGTSRTTKNGSEVSGDSCCQSKLHDGKYMIAISDGMGSGKEAKKSSSAAIKMLERLLTSGFDKDISIGLINSTISLNCKEDMFSTLDIGIIDLTKGNIEFIKNGAAPSYIKHKRNVEIIKALSLPAGILDNVDLVVYDKDINDGDIIVMCSDGIIESNTEYNNKEVWLKDVLENIETDNVQKIADIIIAEAIDNGYGVAKDDMTVFVVKINEIK